ncbi:MAG: hypothetical protein HXS45_02515 [Theionarchaea archaeon]|nr:hypothetical protein [Theionarchaea archaeon]
MLQLANTALVLIFCLLYPSPYFYHGPGIMAWIAGLTSLASYISIQGAQLPEYYTRMKHIAIALGSWSLSIFFLGINLHDPLLLPIGIALISFQFILILLITWRVFREVFYFACVLRGEPEYLEDVERHIKETYVYANRLELVESVYTEEHLSIVNESEWYSSSEFKRGVSLTPLRKKSSDREQITLSCLLHGELRYVDQVNSYLRDCLLDWKIQTFDFLYSKERLYMVSKKK